MVWGEGRKGEEAELRCGGAGVRRKYERLVEGVRNEGGEIRGREEG